jgi:hypothetical protein
MLKKVAKVFLSFFRPLPKKHVDPSPSARFSIRLTCLTAKKIKARSQCYKIIFAGSESIKKIWIQSYDRELQRQHCKNLQRNE